MGFATGLHARARPPPASPHSLGPSEPRTEGSPFSGLTLRHHSNNRRQFGPTEEVRRNSYMTWAKPALAVSKTLGSADILPFLTASLRTRKRLPCPIEDSQSSYTTNVRNLINQPAAIDLPWWLFRPKPCNTDGPPGSSASGDGQTQLVDAYLHDPIRVVVTEEGT